MSNPKMDRPDAAIQLTGVQRELKNAETRWVRAENDLAQCQKEAGYESDYFCYDHRQRAAEAGAEFYRLMDAYIDARIAAALARRITGRGND